jgi:hypothetical protein
MHRLFSLFFVALLFSSCNSLFYIPVEESIYQFDEKRNHFIDFEVKTTHDHALHARLFPSQNQEPKGLLLHFHGNSENLSAHFFAFHWITNEGWDYLIFDYSGYGKSEGKPSREQLRDDGVALLQFAREKIPSSRKKFVVAGQSLGGAVSPVALANWSGRDSIDLLILDATFPNYRAAVKSVLDDSWAWWLKPFVRLGFNEDEAPEKVYQEISKIPTLVTHCEDDLVIKAELGREVYAGIRAPKALWLAPECGHIGFFSHWAPAHRELLIDLLEEQNYSQALNGSFAQFDSALMRSLSRPPTKKR